MVRVLPWRCFWSSEMPNWTCFVLVFLLCWHGERLYALVIRVECGSVAVVSWYVPGFLALRQLVAVGGGWYGAEC